MEKKTLFLDLKSRKKKSSFSRAISSVKSFSLLLRDKIKSHMKEQLFQIGTGSA